MYKRREIAIDLTALLDVILIILFMFVVRSTNQIEAKSTSDNKDSASEIVKLQEENDELKKKVTTNSVLNDTCLVITITIDNDIDSNDEKRKINISSNVDDKKLEVSYNHNDTVYAKNKLNDSLDKVLKEVKDTNQMVLIVFQYDETKIYNKDYKMVDSVLKEISEDEDNTYLAYYDTADEEIID